jgi:hypothetical protein
MPLPKLSPQQPIVPGMTPTSVFVQFMEDLRTSVQQAVDGLQTQIDRLNTQTIGTSYANGLALSGVADGATAKITISVHTRVYTDLTVNLDAGTLTGLAYATTYFVYYDDEDREGGAVSYMTTTNPTVAVTSAPHPYRHFVGTVTTPATSGDPPETGGVVTPPGFPIDYIAP